MHIVLTSMGKYVESNKATHQKFKKKQTLPRQPRNKMTNTQRKLLLTREKSVCAHTCTGRLGAHNHTENNVLYHDRLSIDSNDDLDIRAIFFDATVRVHGCATEYTSMSFSHACCKGETPRQLASFPATKLSRRPGAGFAWPGGDDGMRERAHHVTCSSPISSWLQLSPTTV
jgi:hypothetical protein